MLPHDEREIQPQHSVDHFVLPVAEINRPQPDRVDELLDRRPVGGRRGEEHVGRAVTVLRVGEILDAQGVEHPRIPGSADLRGDRVVAVGRARAGAAVGFLLLAGNLGGVILVLIVQGLIGNPYYSLGALSAAALAGAALATRLPARTAGATAERSL